MRNRIFLYVIESQNLSAPLYIPCDDRYDTIEIGLYVARMHSFI